MVMGVRAGGEEGQEGAAHHLGPLTCVLPSRLILFDLTFSLVPGPFLLLASVAFKVSALVSLH
jgi:hypothetical protein